MLFEIAKMYQFPFPVQQKALVALMKYQTIILKIEKKK